ncbi:MAG TPA: class I SAM-dependent methyltransferase [Nitrososphaerales archaeon]|nr:class I SAM-dependent methyltransferase [Nitrososphaerales archaeon]
MLSLVSILLFLLAAFIGYFFLSGFIWGAGYYPTSKKEIDVVARLLDLREGSKFYDLGSGYGRMIVTMSERYKASSVGIEIDPVKCWWTRQVIKGKKLTGLVTILRSNFLKVNLQNADGIFVFLTRETKIMEKLRMKIIHECKPGTKVVSFEHRFKEWTPTRIEGKLFLYVTPESDSVKTPVDT